MLLGEQLLPEGAERERRLNLQFWDRSDLSSGYIGYCDYELVTKSDIVNNLAYSQIASLLDTSDNIFRIVFQSPCRMLSQFVAIHT